MTGILHRKYQFNIKQISDTSKGKYQWEDYWLIQYQILQTYIIRMARQTVRRITKEILGVKGSREWECLPKNKIIHVPKCALNAFVAFSNKQVMVKKTQGWLAKKKINNFKNHGLINKCIKDCLQTFTKIIVPGFLNI